MSKNALNVKVHELHIIIGTCRICGRNVMEDTDYSEFSGVFTCEMCSNPVWMHTNTHKSAKTTVVVDKIGVMSVNG